MPYTLPKDFAGYEAGTVLQNITLRDARALECNRCGGCCAGDLPDDVVRKDPETGLPLAVWGANAPDDLYEQRYGRRMLQPLVLGDGEVHVGEAWERDADDEPYRAFRCAFFSQEDGLGCCELWDKADPSDEATMRPLNCGEFPVFGQRIDDAIIAGHPFVPAVGAFPRCTWYGLRIVGPYRNTGYWRDRWERQLRGETVTDLSLAPQVFEALTWERGAAAGSVIVD